MISLPKSTTLLPIHHCFFFRKWTFLKMVYWKKKKKVSNSKLLLLELWQILHNSSILGYQDMINGYVNFLFNVF